MCVFGCVYPELAQLPVEVEGKEYHSGLWLTVLQTFKVFFFQTHYFLGRKQIPVITFEYQQYHILSHNK